MQVRAVFGRLASGIVARRLALAVLYDRMRITGARTDRAERATRRVADRMNLSG